VNRVRNICYGIIMWPQIMFDNSKDWLTCNNTRIQVQNLKNQHTCITKKTTKQKPCYESLDVVYHLGYFYVICYECSNIDGYRRRHRNAQQNHFKFNNFCYVDLKIRKWLPCTPSRQRLSNGMKSAPRCLGVQEG